MFRGSGGIIHGNLITVSFEDGGTEGAQHDARAQCRSLHCVLTEVAANMLKWKSTVFVLSMANISQAYEMHGHARGPCQDFAGACLRMFVVFVFIKSGSKFGWERIFAGVALPAAVPSVVCHS